MISHSVCLSISDLFRLVWSSLGPSMLLQMALFHSFLWLCNSPSCIYTISSLSIYLLINIQVISMPWLMWTELLWTWGCMYLFGLWFSLGICPGVGLLDHMTTPIFQFLRNLHPAFHSSYSNLHSWHISKIGAQGSSLGELSFPDFICLARSVPEAAHCLPFSLTPEDVLL